MVLRKCFLCGSTENLTRDHIPPKALFLEPRPADLITVPCCYECNQAFHKQDELLRLFVSVGFNRNKQGDLIWKKVAKRTIGRGRLKQHVKDLVMNTTMGEFRTPDGILRMPYVTIAQEELSGSLIRVVKGLLCHHAPAIPRDELKFNVIQIDQMKLNEVLDPLLTDLRLYGAKGDGAFRYWAGFIPEDKRGGIWVLMFYDSAAFAVFHEPGGRG